MNHNNMSAKKIKRSPRKRNTDLDIAAELIETKSELRSSNKSTTEALKGITRLKNQLKAIYALRSKVKPFRIYPTKGVGSEAVAFLIASDWHIEEKVEAESVNGLNQYNLRIAKERARNFFANSVRLLKIHKKEVRINKVVLALLGYFISGNIHEELMENTELRPIDAIVEAQNILIAGIEYFLRNTRFDFTIICKVGNHSRITSESRYATEVENSLEYIMYRNMAIYFRNEPRARFVIEKSYHTYLQVFDKVFRFHHGHRIAYNGGIGGISIPLNKAIAQWNSNRRPADFDVLGHWHQFADFGTAIMNGSGIGYSPYSLGIKARFERPKQAFFLYDKNRGKTIVAPIILESKPPKLGSNKDKIQSLI